MRKFGRFFRWFALIAILVGVLPACSPKPVTPASPRARIQIDFSGTTMGTDYHASIIVNKSPSDAEYDRLRGGLFEAIDLVDRTMSTYKPDSEVERISNAGAGVPVHVSADTIFVIQKAIEVAGETNGVYDPTIAPLVDLWGFGPLHVGQGAPEAAAIEAAAALVDYRNLSLDESTDTVTKAKDGVKIDLSSIAKGFAVDQATHFFDSEGITDYMVEIGGEVRARGRNKAAVPWRIGIDKPVPENSPGQELEAVVALDNIAIATSGDYRNFRMVDGVRVSHTIDPRTRHPITHHLASVSILAPTCAEADALATAVDVLGPDDGFAFIQSRPATEAYLIIRQPDGTFTTKQTSGFGRYLQ